MKYTLESDLMPILKGDVPLPNFKAEDLARTVNNIAAVGHSLLAKWGWVMHPTENRKQWAQFFLSPASMGNANSGSFDGSGYIMIFSSRKEGPIVGRFAICEHQKKLAADANPGRGWLPGACVKCGLDMTVDSSD